MKRRFPLWLTLVPLILGVTGYWWWWSGQRDALRTELAAVLPGKTVVIGGFPYRLEAEIASPARASKAADIAAQASAASIVLNRGPFQRELTIIRSLEPRLSARIPALAASGLTISAPTAQSSLHLDKKGNVARLSTVFDDARIDLTLLGAQVTAPHFELHVRETPGRTPEAWSPTLPERAQVVLAGQDLRIGAGAPLTLAADLRVTGPTRLIDYARWAGRGTVEVRGLTLADAAGEVLRLDATLVTTGGAPRASGTIVTVCPLSVRAAFTGGPRVSEQRLRIAAKLAFGGSPGAWTLAGLSDVARPVRAQQPACPALR